MYLTDELYFDERDMDPKYWRQSERLKEPVSKVEFRHPEPGFIEWPEAVYETVYRVNIPYSVTLTTSSGKKKKVRNKIHILQEDADKNVYYVVNKLGKIGRKRYHTYEEPIQITSINGVPIRSAKKGMELIIYASKLKNRIKTLANIPVYR